jgi:hypothetical protein
VQSPTTVMVKPNLRCMPDSTSSSACMCMQQIAAKRTKLYCNPWLVTTTASLAGQAHAGCCCSPFTPRGLGRCPCSRTLGQTAVKQQQQQSQQVLSASLLARGHHTIHRRQQHTQGGNGASQGNTPRQQHTQGGNGASQGNTPRQQHTQGGNGASQGNTQPQNPLNPILTRHGAISGVWCNFSRSHHLLLNSVSR